MVGTGRFELPTPRTPSECSTRLSHVPTRFEPERFEGVDLQILHHGRGQSGSVREKSGESRASVDILKYWDGAFRPVAIVLRVMSIADNIASVRERMASAARATGRDPNEISLMAVTKTVSPGPIREAYQAGIRLFGENRVQEFAGKSQALSDLSQGRIAGAAVLLV